MIKEKLIKNARKVDQFLVKFLKKQIREQTSNIIQKKVMKYY